MVLNRVFVYGSLKQGMNNHYIIAPYVETISQGKTRGIMYDLPECGYPAMVEGMGTVYGEVLLLSSVKFPQALAELDEFEEYYGEGNPYNVYQRVVQEIQLADRYTVKAFTYLWAQRDKLECLGRLIHDGYWRG